MSKQKNNIVPNNSYNEFLLYIAPNGKVKVEIFLHDENVWLTQDKIALLFGVDRTVITKHLKNIFESRELNEISVSAKIAHTASDGKTYQTKFYSLDAIISVGYRVNSTQATHFRIWATERLKEYIIKGFTMDDERLKKTDKWDYFDEWLERIRDIRASEKRFYQKIRDLYTTAVDYAKDSEQALLFFKKVQNKMLWAVTGKTAAEIIDVRSDPALPNMGLTSWKGSIVRKADVAIAKNYLNENEIKDLNEIVTMYLDYAERQARLRKTVTMEQWADKLDAFLTFNEHELLTHPGKIRSEVARTLAEERYDAFDAERKRTDAIAADEEDIRELEEMEKRLSIKLDNSGNISPDATENTRAAIEEAKKISRDPIEKSYSSAKALLEDCD